MAEREQKKGAAEELGRLGDYYGAPFAASLFGFAFVLCWLYTGQRLAPQDLDGVFQIVQYVAVFLGACLAAGLARHDEARPAAFRALLFVFSLAATLSALCLAAAAVLPHSDAVCLLAAFVSGFAYALMLVSWGGLYARMDVKRALFCVFCSSVLACLVKCCLLLVSSTVVQALICALFPCLAYACWRKAPDSLEEAPGDARRFSALSPRLRVQAVGIAIFSFVLGVLLSSDMGSFSTLSALHIVGHLIAVAVLLVLLWMQFKDQPLESSMLWLIVLLLIAAGVVIGALFEGSFSIMYVTLLGSAQTLTVAFLMLALCDIAHNSSWRAHAVLGVGLSLYYGPLALGFLVSFLCGGTIDESKLFVVALFGLLLVFFFLLYLPDRYNNRDRMLADLRPRLDDSSQETMDRRMEVAAQRYGLSPREQEVALLYAQGRSKPFIAEELFIAEGTVKDHIKSVYKKMGVHSKQELISLLQSL